MARYLAHQTFPRRAFCLYSADHPTALIPPPYTSSSATPSTPARQCLSTRDRQGPPSPFPPISPHWHDRHPATKGVSAKATDRPLMTVEAHFMEIIGKFFLLFLGICPCHPLLFCRAFITTIFLPQHTTTHTYPYTLLSPLFDLCIILVRMVRCFFKSQTPRTMLSRSLHAFFYCSLISLSAHPNLLLFISTPMEPTHKLNISIHINATNFFSIFQSNSMNHSKYSTLTKHWNQKPNPDQRGFGGSRTPRVPKLSESIPGVK